MKIESNKYYKTRDGKRLVYIIGTVSLNGVSVNLGQYYTEDDNFLTQYWYGDRFIESEESSYDLVEEVGTDVLC